jgi:hypothetical protein
LGDATSAATAVSAGGALLGAGAAVGVPALVSAGVISAAAVPFIGPAIAAITLAVGLLVKNSGCGVTCVETSQWANQAEPLLQKNIASYFDQPAPRAQSTQTVALANFDQIWNTLVQQCGQPGTGNAGVRCVSDRQAGACTWKQTTTSTLLQYPGEPQPGACWNWFSGYRDPIANDPDVVPDATLAAQTATAAASSAATSIDSSLSTLVSSNPNLLYVGLGLAGLVALWVAFK